MAKITETRDGVSVPAHMSHKERIFQDYNSEKQGWS